MSKTSTATKAKASKRKAPEATKPEAQPEKKAPPKRAGDGDGPGVIGSIVEFLKGATEKKPISKKALLAKLQERFPDRPETAMWRTINCQVPSRIRKEKELDVRKGEGGYWVA